MKKIIIIIIITALISLLFLNENTFARSSKKTGPAHRMKSSGVSFVISGLALDAISLISMLIGYVTRNSPTYEYNGYEYVSEVDPDRYALGLKFSRVGTIGIIIGTSFVVTGIPLWIVGALKRQKVMDLDTTRIRPEFNYCVMKKKGYAGINCSF